MSELKKMYRVIYSPEKKENSGVFFDCTYSQVVCAEDENAAIERFQKYMQGSVIRVESAENALTAHY